MKTNKYRLKNFSISFLAIVLGMMGFSLAFQKTEESFLQTNNLYYYPLIFTWLLFLLVVFFYILKIVKFPEEFKKEFLHPIKINFFPILAKIFLLLSVIYLAINMDISRYFWYIGAGLQLFFSFLILSIWIRGKNMDWKFLNPAWFIPIVGNVIVPIAGVAHGYTEISYFFFSIGLVMWLALFVVVFNRIIFHHPIPDKLLPTFFILFAPPAIAFIAYIKLSSSFDVFARVLYYISMFLFVLIILQFKMFLKIKFYLSWWAYSFPLAAVTIASLLFFHVSGIEFFKYVSILLFLFLNLVIFYLLYRTVKAIVNAEICVEED
ncbi:C4-dicarboxylate ABC transporter [Candidatus Parcubacteria bacterium]|mgnify:CR=1 FL=1|nr:MAG: C4-dicarboxylate ABC transporter [Candidatus Parcubacteria bacterium]